MGAVKKIMREFEVPSPKYLVGIRTTLKGYQLAFHLNRMARSNFKRSKKDTDLLIENSFLERYEWIQNDSENLCDLFASKFYVEKIAEEATNTFRLIKEDPLKEVSLLPEFGQFDYFIKTQYDSILKSLKKTLEKLPQVHMSYVIPQSQIKTPLNLIFD